MNIKNINITIQGRPNEKVRVVYRNRTDPEPPPIWEGELGNDGQTEIPVPRAHIVVVGEGRTVFLPLDELPSEDQVVRLDNQANK
jgi:hypothetical protein